VIRNQILILVPLDQVCMRIGVTQRCSQKGAAAAISAS